MLVLGTLFQLILVLFLCNRLASANNRWRKEKIAHMCTKIQLETLNESSQRDIKYLLLKLKCMTISSSQFSKQEIRTLITLCHPDKHNGSTIANDITAKLLKMR